LYRCGTQRLRTAPESIEEVDKIFGLWERNGFKVENFGSSILFGGTVPKSSLFSDSISLSTDPRFLSKLSEATREFVHNW
jgi:hypothetical protein